MAAPFAPQAQRPSPFGSTAATPPRTGTGAPYQPQFAIQPFAPHLLRPPSPSSLSGNSAFLTGGVVQRHGQVIQPSLSQWFWNSAGYITDFISFSSMVGGIISAWYAAASATGWGFLVPLLLPAIGTLLNKVIANIAEDTGHEGDLGNKKGPWSRWLMDTIMPFVQTVMPLLLTFVGTQNSDKVWEYLAAALTTLLLLTGEALRVWKTLDRDSGYKALYQKVMSAIEFCREKCKKSGENEQLVYS